MDEVVRPVSAGRYPALSILLSVDTKLALLTVDDAGCNLLKFPLRSIVF